MAAARGARRLESVHWLARAFAGVAGAAGAAEVYATGLGPLVAGIAAVAGFGIVYALLLAGIRRYSRLLEETDSTPKPESREPAASKPPRLIRTRRREAPERRLMAPEDSPRRP
jgi:hypothetical protein